MSPTPTPRRRAPASARTTTMDTVTPGPHQESWDAYPDDQQDEPLPPRPRRQFLTRRTAALGALVACAIGFYAGIRLEKSQVSGSSTTVPLAGAGAAGAGARAGAAGARTGTATSRAGTGSAAGGGGGLAALFSGRGRSGAGAAGGVAGANASFGTVSSINGTTLYVTETTGNTVKVKLSRATKISKTQSVRRSAIRPGDTLVITGVTGSRGTVAAASITDSGARTSGGSGSSSSSSGSSSGSGASAVGSLFSSGG